MSSLQVSLLGSVHVVSENGSCEIRLTRTIQALFAYLLLERNRTHPRDVLVNLFWGDFPEEHAHRSLNTALWRLRQALEPAGLPADRYLVVDHLGEVGINPHGDFWLDTAEFESSINRLISHPVDQLSSTDEQLFEHSLQLYQGDLLDGFYDDWAIRERERLRFLFLNGLAFMMRHYKTTHAYEKSLIYGQHILSMDPLREEIHREMMRIYLENGQRTLALRQYELCRKALVEELAIEPMEETQALYAAAFSHTAAAPSSSTDYQALQQLLVQLKQMNQAISSTRGQVQQMMTAVEEILSHSH